MPVSDISSRWIIGAAGRGDGDCVDVRDEGLSALCSPPRRGIVVATELEDIGMFEAKVCRSFAAPFDPRINLLFWKPSPWSGRNEQLLKKEGEKIVE